MGYLQGLPDGSEVPEMTVMELAIEQNRLDRLSDRYTSLIGIISRFHRDWSPKKWNLGLFWIEQRKSR